MAENQGVQLSQLTLGDLQGLSDLFESDVMDVFNVTTSLASRAVVGGTAPRALAEQLAAAEKLLNLE
jgi:argininosuccinate lyase